MKNILLMSKKEKKEMLSKLQRVGNLFKCNDCGKLFEWIYGNGLCSNCNTEYQKFMKDPYNYMVIYHVS